MSILHIYLGTIEKLETSGLSALDVAMQRRYPSMLGILCNYENAFSRNKKSAYKKGYWFWVYTSNLRNDGRAASALAIAYLCMY